MTIVVEDIYAGLAGSIQKRFDASNYEVKKSVPIGINKKRTRLMKDEMGRKMMKEFDALRPKIYSYFTENFYVDKKVKGTKKCAIKREIKFQNYKDCLEKNKTILNSQQRFLRKTHNVFTEK